MCWINHKKRLAEKKKSSDDRSVHKNSDEEDFLLVDYTVAELSDDDSGIFFQ